MRRSRYVAQAGLIAAVYAVLTVLVLQMPFYLGWGIVQFRLSEALTVLAALTPSAIPGLALGTAAANATQLSANPIAIYDVLLGSIATLVGAAWTWRFRRNAAVALLGPILSNALIVPIYLPLMLAGLGLYEVPFLGVDLEGHWLGMYLIGFAGVAFGETVVVYGLGWPLLSAMRRLGIGAAGQADTK